MKHYYIRCITVFC